MLLDCSVGRQSGVPGSEVTTEPDKDKVVDKVFTEVKDKSSEVKVESSDQREENHRSQKKQTTARRQTKKEPETETSQKKAEEDIGGLDDFCEDNDDDDHGGDDDDWRPSEEEEAKVSKDDDAKEPRAKKNKMAGMYRLNLYFPILTYKLTCTPGPDNLHELTFNLL